MHRCSPLGGEEPWWELAWWWPSPRGGLDVVELSVGMQAVMGRAGMGSW